LYVENLDKNMNRAELLASNPYCVKNPTGDKCPQFIQKYKDCKMNSKTGKPETFIGAESPGLADSVIDKKCWNGDWYERKF